MQILICEDTEGSRAQWLREIGEAIPGDWPKPVPLKEHILVYREIFARLKALRNRELRAEEPCEIDGMDIVVVDFDLELYDTENARHTGEELARYCRLVSDVGYVVVMNQYNRTAQMDLRLTGHSSSYGDRNIASTVIGLSGFWRDVEPGAFRPWEWDDIATVVRGRRSLAKRLNGKMDEKIVDVVGIPSEMVSFLPDEACEHLNRQAVTDDDLKATTFRQFLSQQIESKDVDALVDLHPARAAVMAVARVAKWLSRLVLGPQDLLVDVPHLVERLPFLMAEDFGAPSQKEAWDCVPRASVEAVRQPFASECAFIDAPVWFGRAALWWPLIDRHPKMPELRQKASVRSTPDLVFAEDLSVFVEEDAAEEFRSDFSGRYAHRWAKPVNGIRYEPRRRLLES